MARIGVLREQSLANVNIDNLTEPHRYELIRLCLSSGKALLPEIEKLSDAHQFELLPLLLNLSWKEVLSQCDRLNWEKIGGEKGTPFLKDMSFTL